MNQIINRLNTRPLPVPRTTRTVETRLLTSLPAGKMVPLAAYPLLREDQLSAARYVWSFEMGESVEVLLNNVNVRVLAYFVPFLAHPRFGGSMDRLNAYYNGLEGGPGDPAGPLQFFTGLAFALNNKVLTSMGMHARVGQIVNSFYNEAYNLIWNFRATNRSPSITQRALTATTTLANAFWINEEFAHIVPDFDQAAMEGAVPLDIIGAKLPLKRDPGGVGQVDVTVKAGQTVQIVTAATGARNLVTGTANDMRHSGAAATPASNVTGVNNLEVSLQGMFAELETQGVSFSLANIDLARKTQAFAKLREQYSGHADEYIIDMMMSGLSIPDQMWKQPILLGDAQTIFGMTKRYATDAENLTESVVNGMTSVEMTIAMPRCPTGGTVMFVAEITPQQLFERQRDPFLHTMDVAGLPDYLRDELDPERVDVVVNEDVDVDHATPNGVFGYAPLNWRWTHQRPNIGGKFYRPQVDVGFDEDRQRIWAVENQNPVLNEDFYICKNLHLKPFVDQTSDTFECTGRGIARITGNTVFGGALIESTGSYEAVMEKAPLERIEK
ncbi:major capsid protein [Flyfo microvirus Tbat2_95]|nr:major capsid protein [Flyfo microvirus Tbat2_95]